MKELHLRTNTREIELASLVGETARHQGQRYDRVFASLLGSSAHTAMAFLQGYDQPLLVAIVDELGNEDVRRRIEEARTLETIDQQLDCWTALTREHDKTVIGDWITQSTVGINRIFLMLQRGEIGLAWIDPFVLQLALRGVASVDILLDYVRPLPLEGVILEQGDTGFIRIKGLIEFEKAQTR